jgi:hypothetical protein
VPKWIRAARNTLNGDEPQIAMSNHCNEPWGCSYQGYCTRKSGRRAAFPVELLPNASGKRLAAELRDEGYSDLRRVPRHRMTTDLLNRVHAVTRTTEPYIDRVGARADIAGWKYPRAYLDFETVNFTVPIWAGTRPFQHIPFQFSCVIEKSDGSTARTDFLDLSGDNPARACAEKLLKALRGCQSVIAYSAKTERGVIQSLAARFPDLKHQLLALASRVVDLLPVVKTCYYHRDMLGSFSLKSVLPTIQPRLAYDLLDEVTEGTAAQRAYCEATERGTPAARRDDIRRKLLRYCGLDAVGMLEIVRHLTMT